MDFSDKRKDRYMFDSQLNCFEKNIQYLKTATWRKEKGEGGGGEGGGWDEVDNNNINNTSNNNSKQGH